MHRGSRRFGTESVREIALKNLRWKVISLLSAQRAFRCDPRIWHGAYWSGDVLTAFLAADREVAAPNLRKVEHECQYRRTKGESSMWISTEENPTGHLRANAMDLISSI
jgi:hypothetical protein